MSKIKLKTTKENRFGKVLNVSGVDVTINSKGETEVEETEVARLILAGFEMVDKTQKFQSTEQVQAAEKVEVILSDARKEAEKIVSEAKQQAAKILSEAKQQAQDSTEKLEEVEKEKESVRSSLLLLKNEELKLKLKESGALEDSYKNLTKDELVTLIIKIAFSE